jgi:hypothetical protein
VGVGVYVSVCVGLWVSSVTAFNKHFGSKNKKMMKMMMMNIVLMVEMMMMKMMTTTISFSS